MPLNPHCAKRVVHAPRDRRARPNRHTGRVRQLSPDPEFADRAPTKLLHEHYAESIPLNLFRSEQQHIAAEREQADKVLAACTLRHDQIEAELHAAPARLADCARSYADGNQRMRREMNHTLFTKLYVPPHAIVGADLNGLSTVLLADDLP